MSFMEWRRGSQDIMLCSSGYRLCSVVKYVLSSVLGSSSLQNFQIEYKKKMLASYRYCQVS